MCAVASRVTGGPKRTDGPALKGLLVRGLFALAMAGLLVGCAALASSQADLALVSVQPPQYQLGEVKGYQHRYPKDHVLILLPVNNSRGSEPNAIRDVRHAVPAGSVQVGVISDQNGEILQRIYSSPIEVTVQSALAISASEAGLVPTVSDARLESALRRTDEDYVLVSQITKCWVAKRRVTDLDGEAVWETEAVFALNVQIYKPPFHVAFWEGRKTTDYYDPPLDYGFLQPVDPVALYDHPGQVLSVALTRTVAGIFAGDDLLKLVAEDYSMTRQDREIARKPNGSQ